MRKILISFILTNLIIIQAFCTSYTWTGIHTFNANVNANTVNTTSVTIGASLIGNSTGIYHTGTINSASMTIGSSWTVNSTGAYVTGLVNATSYNTGATGTEATITVGTVTTGSYASVTNTVFELDNIFSVDTFIDNMVSLYRDLSLTLPNTDTLRAVYNIWWSRQQC